MVISYEEYHPYGSTAYHSGSGSVDVSLKRYRYTGKERDEETGLYYHGARYYAPWLARWTAVDPRAWSVAAKQEMPYSFANCQPTILCDPDGCSATAPESTPGTWSTDRELSNRPRPHFGEQLRRELKRHADKLGVKGEDLLVIMVSEASKPPKTSGDGRFADPTLINGRVAGLNQMNAGEIRKLYHGETGKYEDQRGGQRIGGWSTNTVPS